MLEILNLTKVYSSSSKPSVDNLTLSVNDGEIFGFIGPNGAGKSTTIKCMSGIITPTEGKIFINGVDLLEDPMTAKKQIGYVSDDHVMYEGLTGVEYVNFIADVFSVPEKVRKERVTRYAELFGLTAALHQQIGSYSHGMKQKLNVIGALVHEPKLWILDEPMTGLDPRSSYNLKNLMREHAANGNTVFFSSHVLEVVEKLCDRIGIIDEGKLIAVCSMSELKQRNADKSLEELFLKLTETEEAYAYAAKKSASGAASGGQKPDVYTSKSDTGAHSEAEESGVKAAGEVAESASNESASAQKHQANGSADGAEEVK